MPYSSEEEEEDDDEPVLTRKSGGFKMITKTTITKSDEAPVESSRMVEEKYEVSVGAAQQSGDEAAQRAKVEQEQQAKLQAQQEALERARKAQEEAMKAAQQEALERAKKAQEEAMKAAQEKAQQQIAKREQEEAARRAQQQRAEQEARELAKREQQLREAQQKAQQEALEKARMAKEQAIKEAQARAKAQQQASAAEAQNKAQQQARQAGGQAAAVARAEHPEPETNKAQPAAVSPQEAQARREAQIKAEKAKAEQLRAQQQARLMAAQQVRQAQAQAEKMQQQRQQSDEKTATQPQPQPRTAGAKIGAATQADQKEPQAAQRGPAVAPEVRVQQKPQPPVPNKPRGQQPSVPARTSGARPTAAGAPTPAATAPAATKTPAAKPAKDTPTAAVTINQQALIVGSSDQELYAMRGGQVQQAYLSSIAKPTPLPEQQEIKPVHMQDDQSWVKQSRIPIQIQAPKPNRITVPELQGTVEVRPTVIVPRPAQTTRVQWNELPENEVKEPGTVPRVKAQEWHPDKQNEIVGAQPVRSTYNPTKIDRVWPPLQEEKAVEAKPVRATKATDDTAWIRGEKIELETGAAWAKTAQHNIKEQRIWPPQEAGVRVSGFTGSRLPAVQWPPPEFEQHEQQDIEILQTRLPVKPHQRQWPPPPPEYHTVDSVSDQVITEQQSIPSKTQQTTTTYAKRAVRA